MLISAVIDPSAFNEDYIFDKSYRNHAENLLKDIVENGLLIFDSRGELKEAFIDRIESLSANVGQYLQILLEELLKIEPKRFVACSTSLNGKSSDDLLKLAHCLKMDTKADALIVSDQSLEILRSEQVCNESIVPLSEYRYSEFEKIHWRYKLQSINTLSQSDMENAIIHSTQFNNWLASIVNEEVFASRERLITLLEEKSSYEALAREFREFFNGYYTLALELEEHEKYVLNIIKGTDALAYLKHRVSAVETQRKSSPLGREARRMGMSIHSDPVPKVKVAALSLDGFQTLLQTLVNCRLFVSRNRLVKLMETEGPMKIIDILRIEFYEFFVCYLELELFLEDYDYDPDEGLELCPEFIESLKREDEYIKAGGKMSTLEDVTKRLGI